MELVDYLRILRRYWISVVGVTLGGVVAGALVSILTTPVYSASASVIFSVPNGSTPAELNLGAAYTASQVKSYMELVRTPLILDPVIRRLDLHNSAAELAGRITPSNPSTTAIVSVAVTGTDAAQVAAIADAVAQELMAVAVDQISPKGSGGTRAIQATLVSPARIPATPTAPRVIQNLGLGAMLGLLLALGQAALREYLYSRSGDGHHIDPRSMERFGGPVRPARRSRLGRRRGRARLASCSQVAHLTPARGRRHPRSSGSMSRLPRRQKALLRDHA